MVYADYEYYTAAYLGTAIQRADFPRLSLRASSFLDYYTQGRAAQNANLDAVKMACCAVADQYHSIDLARKAALNALQNSANAGEAGELQSQSVGSWSKTYRSGGESAQYHSIDLARKAALNALQNSANAGEAGELQSQSVGSWSKTYRSGGESAQQATTAAQAAQASLASVAAQYLSSTGLLYRGMGCGCGYVPTCCDAL